MNFLNASSAVARKQADSTRPEGNPDTAEVRAQANASPSRWAFHPERCLSKLANLASSWAGSTGAFLLAAGVVAIWGVSGPFFGFSDTWQLLINSGTSIITFLMVFLIQRSQNKDSQAIHLKLNELIASVNGASNRLINIEQVDDDHLQGLREDFRKLVQRTMNNPCSTDPHSVTELGDESAVPGVSVAS